MKKFNLVDVQGNHRFQPVTQGEQNWIDHLINKCNEERSLIVGFIETRKEILHTAFDRQAVRDLCELTRVYNRNNEVLNMAMRVMIEKISRDVCRESMVEDVVKAVKLRIAHYNGEVERVVDDFEHYYTSENMVSFAQTWREACEEVEKGKVIYFEPKSV